MFPLLDIIVSGRRPSSDTGTESRPEVYSGCVTNPKAPEYTLLNSLFNFMQILE